MEHLRTHGPLRYMCSLCDFKDSVQSRITTHMKQVHKVTSTNPVPLNMLEKNSEHAQFVLVPKVSWFACGCINAVFIHM